MKDESRNTMRTFNQKRIRFTSEDYKFAGSLQKDKEVKAYEILLENVLKYLDTVLLT